MFNEEILTLTWAKVGVIGILGLVFLMNMVVLLWWRPRKIEDHFSRQGIRGPPYKFFIGNVKELVAMMIKASSQPMPNLSHNILPRVLSFYHHWKKIYGATFLVWFGSTGRLTVSDPNLISEIFTTKSEFYEKYEAHPLIKQLEGDGLLNLKGEKWAHHRKIIAPTFHMENLKSMVPVMTQSMVEIAEKWTEIMTEGSEEVEIDVSEWFQTLTEDVITRTAFGSSYEDGKAIFRLQSQQMVLAADAFQKVFIPGYRFWPTQRNIKSWKLDKEIRKSLTKLIEARRRSKTTTTTASGPKDLLGLMIDAGDDFTASDIVEECKTFFFAGKHTTSNLLTWTTLLLAMYPDWQSKARDELLSVCGPRDTPSKDDIPKLKTLGMILNESLRLYSPTVATIRKAKADVELGGYKIPRGTELLIPILAVHHDTATWGADADEFDPNRFKNGVARAATRPAAFIPFGLGLRTCIGQNLAVLHAKLALAVMLRRFSFCLAPTYQHAPTVLMLLYPQHGAPVIFRRLEHGTASAGC